jgi:hypothetical protein
VIARLDPVARFQSLTGALPAYERAGMRVVPQSMRYEKELRPGIDLTTRELGA